MLLISVKPGGNHLGIFEEQCFTSSNNLELSGVKHGVVDLKGVKASFNLRKLSS